jgi:hypothetical protein
MSSLALAEEGKRYTPLPLTDVSWTLEKIDERLGYQCPFRLAERIMSSEKPGEKFAWIKSSLDTLRGVLGKENTDAAFYAFGNQLIANFFDREPMQVIDSFARIAQSTDQVAANYALRALVRQPIAEIYVNESPRCVEDMFGRVVQEAGGNARFVFELLGLTTTAGMSASDLDRTVDALLSLTKYPEEVTRNIEAVFVVSRENAECLAKNPAGVATLFDRLVEDAKNREDWVVRAKSIVYIFRYPRVMTVAIQKPEDFVQAVGSCPSEDLFLVGRLAGGGILDRAIIARFATIANLTLPNARDALDSSLSVFFGNQLLAHDCFERFTETLLMIATELDGEAINKTLFSLASRLMDAENHSFFDDFERVVISEEIGMRRFTEKYGVRPMRIMGFFDGKAGIHDPDYYDATMEQNMKSGIMEIAERQGLNPNFLAAALFQEGFINKMDQTKFQFYIKDVDSFSEVEMDSFYVEIDELKRGGYIPHGFGDSGEFEIGSEVTNENGFRSRRVKFKTQHDAFEAFGAMLAARRDRFLLQAKKMGYQPDKLSPEVVWAGTYLYYNAANPQKKVEDIGVGNLLDKYTPTKQSIADFRYNYMRVVSTADYLRAGGTFGNP